MARTFARGSSHKITLSIGALNFAGPITFATITKRASNGTQQTFYRAGDGAGASLGCGVQVTGDKLFYWNQSTRGGRYDP